MSSILEEFRDDDVIIETPPPPIEELPRVYAQPKAPPQFHRARNVGAVPLLVLRCQRCLNREDTSGFGKSYSLLVNEFQPGIRWAISCWEYLLSTEGCKFLPRSVHERKCRRGDYRAFLEADYHRLVHQVFKRSLIDYLHQTTSLDFAYYLAARFGENILGTYRDLDIPENPQQRRLTPYSYLRCTPYQFMNNYHHQKVSSLIWSLPERKRKAIEYYFLHFFTVDSAAKMTETTPEEFVLLIHKTLRQLRHRNKLVLYLLQQIERY